MAECECVPKCPFFHDKMGTMPTMANMMKQRYCQGDNSTCARWVVRAALGPAVVPQDLFPNQADRAEKIIRNGGQ
jgi:uncharacterized membrane protein YkvA (DUF1232 family)